MTKALWSIPFLSSLSDSTARSAGPLRCHKFIVINPPMFCRLQNTVFSRMPTSGSSLVRQPLVIPLQKPATRTSPRDPIGVGYSAIGMMHLLQSQTDEAIVWLERGRSAIPSVPRYHSWLASAYALKGETQRAAAELAEARRLLGGNSFSSIAAMRDRYGQVEKIRALYQPHISPACAKPRCRRSRRSQV
jgi:hypothetical protein